MVLSGPTDQAGIIYILEKVHGSLRSLTDEAISSMHWRMWMVLSGPSLMR